MKDYIVKNDWKIIENNYLPEYNQITESLLSLGNGHMGQRANFEETYTGPSLQGTYVAGVYYPDKTKVGWWKNGYPEYFAKVLNSCNWTALEITVNGEVLDVHTCKINDWHRELDMKEGYLHRSMSVELPNGIQLEVTSTRINSMHMDELGAYRYAITPLSADVDVQIRSSLDFDVTNKDSNYDEKFWIERQQIANEEQCMVMAETKKTAFVVAVAMKNTVTNGSSAVSPSDCQTASKKCTQIFTAKVLKGETLTLDKFAVVASSTNVAVDQLPTHTTTQVAKAANEGWSYHLAKHAEAWADIWSLCDITIEGDTSAQQGIRFNIFQLFQTYTGKDDRLNIGPKGFTGEKYGGSTYWDTEAYCIPFYLGTADPSVARNLLVYRYKHLEKAIENAAKLGFHSGAALYPMVTMNGEECHNEWEITFEEIHRNGAIAYAIYDYIRYTGDTSYLAEYGVEVLLGIARFWAQRANWSAHRNQYVMLGVTGPNEYENNVNNNWYTNYIAAWCLSYARECLHYVQDTDHAAYQRILEKTSYHDEEGKKWQHIVANMYYPTDEQQGIFLQQDGFLDKVQTLVDDLPAADRPLNQKWSWDRILRSVFIKQADVLQGLYFFEEDFDEETHRRNFAYYEPRTVHESSLSPCVHSILAAKLKMDEKAYEMYLRTSRLDLDDYNNDTEDGCHITSMAGTWLAVVKGFGGQRVKEETISFVPRIPQEWQGLGFKLKFRGVLYHIHVTHQEVTIANLSSKPGTVNIYGTLHAVAADQTITIPTQH